MASGEEAESALHATQVLLLHEKELVSATCMRNGSVGVGSRGEWVCGLRGRLKALYPVPYCGIVFAHRAAVESLLIIYEWNSHYFRQRPRHVGTY